MKAHKGLFTMVKNYTMVSHNPKL